MGDLRNGDGVVDVDVVHGCLMGSAIGDALGSSVEADSISAIRAKCGPDGLTGFPAGTAGSALTSSITQMMLFTVEGVIRSSVRSRCHGLVSIEGCVHSAYLRWLATQGYSVEDHSDHVLNGWLRRQVDLHHIRSPGSSAIAALRAGMLGSPESPVNDSKGCGGVPRVAVVGLTWRPDEAFDLGCRLGALTHGHPTGWLPAGALAATISYLVEGASLSTAIYRVTGLLEARGDSDEVLNAIGWAKAVASAGFPSPEEIDQLAENGKSGWIASEALAIALCCALVAEQQSGGALEDSASLFGRALQVSVNHSGNSAATGTVTGSLIGTAVREANLPLEWTVPVDLRPLIGVMAHDLVIEFGPQPPSNDRPGDWVMATDIPSWWWDRYPGF